MLTESTNIHHRYYAKCSMIKDVHFVQNDPNDLLSSEGAQPAPTCDEVSLLVKRGWECRAEMSKFYKDLLLIDWEYIFSNFVLMNLWAVSLKSTSVIKGRGVYCWH